MESGQTYLERDCGGQQYYKRKTAPKGGFANCNLLLSEIAPRSFNRMLRRFDQLPKVKNRILNPQP